MKNKHKKVFPQIEKNFFQTQTLKPLPFRAINRMQKRIRIHHKMGIRGIITDS